MNWQQIAAMFVNSSKLGGWVRAGVAAGLGLAIAKSLVELHGGAMRIRSVLGAGTMVVVRLPLEARKPLRAEREVASPPLADSHAVLV